MKLSLPAVLALCAFDKCTARAVSTAAPSTIPIISVVETPRAPVPGVNMVIGEVTKHPSNPLFIQDKPWEPRLDNGCEYYTKYYNT